MEKRKSKNRRVPPGGPATINGVLYQLLWSLLRASRAHFITPAIIKGGRMEAVTILVEPAGGGGDLVLTEGKRRYVEQIKARPDGSTWSLREIVEDVIPDLYIAAASNANDTDFRFITEGRMGNWQDVYTFFRSLRYRSHIGDDPFAHLNDDDRAPLRFAAQMARHSRANGDRDFWERGQYTEQKLFRKILTEVRKRKIIRDGEDETTTALKLRGVLARFEFVGGQLMKDLQDDIDSHLAAIADRNDDVPWIRDSLAMELARRAAAGDAEINCNEFFQSQGLDAVPLTDWGALRAAARRISETTLRHLGYEPSEDVRLAAADKTLVGWPTTAPMLAITGASGCGKSWRSYALCALGQPGKGLTAPVTAGPSIDITLERAAEAVWQDIAGHDERIPLQRIANRVRRVLGDKVIPWLTLVIDGTLGLDQAAEIIRKPWEEWGIRVIISVEQATARSLEVQSRGRCMVISIGEFTTRELHAYLESLLGDRWPVVPEFVRNSVRNPLIASIYRKIVERMPAREWTPYSEYEIFAAFWGRLIEQDPLDSIVVTRLADQFLSDAVYPWSAASLSDAGASAGFVPRLERIGWLRVTYAAGGSSFELPHDRLLNWACAQALLFRARESRLDTESFSSQLQSYLTGSSEKHGHRLGFVPMDVLWLMCHDELACGRVADVIAGLESQYQQRELLYKHLLPTLGTAVLDALAARLRANLADLPLSKMIARTIAQIGGTEATRTGLSLLDDENPLAQRASCSLFARHGSAEALGKLWTLHNLCQADPTPFLQQGDWPPSGNWPRSHDLYEATFAALKQCCRVCPDWLAKAITDADPERESISDLAYLLASIDSDVGQHIWRDKKRALFQKLPMSKRRSLAMCIDRYSDRDEIPWLISSVEVEDDMLGATALRTLVRLAPKEAVNHWQRLPMRDLYLARNWFADELFAVAPDAARAKLREIMRAIDVWKVATVYGGRQYWMDVQTLDILLDDFERQLKSVLTAPDWRGNEPLYGPLNLLAEINSKPLIDHLQRWRGSALEHGLCEFVLRIGPRGGLGRDSLVRDEALNLLYYPGMKVDRNSVMDAYRTEGWRK
ncbi:MAG TPA: hypothetical protein VMV10_18975 [Pirellulales bacterium]|nr:hypothetical protein [Pirellulales bacterium]